MWPFDRFVSEWPVISAAPTIFFFLAIAIFGVAFGIAHLWTRREMNALKAEMNALRVNEKVQETRIGDLKDENKSLAAALEKQGSAPAAVVYGNTSVQAAFLEISQPGQLIKFYGVPADWDDQGLDKFARFMRLKEAGLAKIEQTTQPNTTVISGTSAAFDYANTPLPLRAAAKKSDDNA